MDIKTLVEDFATSLQKLIDAQAIERARTTVMGALGMSPGRGPGRTGRSAMASSPRALVATKARKKSPIQLCPVPGCKNAAAPVFGMVCSKHQDVAKSKIKKYRAARKAKKLGVRRG